MKTPLIPVEIPSIYRSGAGRRVLLPTRMALCTPDTHQAILAIQADLAAAGGELLLSDLFRSYDMQLQAHLDFTSGKKAAFSPAPGGSMHEAGRAFDFDLSAIKIPLKHFWELAAAHGATPIIRAPDAAAAEAWHHDCQGSHRRVYQHYAEGKAANMRPYQAMAASAILATGARHDLFAGKEREAHLQASLIRLGHDVGSIDGSIGMKTRAALARVGLADAGLDAALTAVEDLCQAAFPGEFRVVRPVPPVAAVPEHLVA